MRCPLLLSPDLSQDRRPYGRMEKGRRIAGLLVLNDRSRVPQKSMPPIPPIPEPAPPGMAEPCFFGSSATIASVVISRPATEAIISARSRSGSIGFGAKVMAPEDRKQGEIFRDVDLAPIGLAAGLTFGFPLSFGRPMGVESLNATRQALSECRE